MTQELYIEKIGEEVVTNMFSEEWAKDEAETDGKRGYHVSELRESLEAMGCDQRFILRCYTHGYHAIHSEQKGDDND